MVDDTCQRLSAAARDGQPGPLAWFGGMIDRCYDYAEAAKGQGRPIVGIMCEFTPREIILAAGGVPVCLCAGSAEMVESGEKALPANLCPIIKSTLGYSIEGENPFLEMSNLLVAETTCDGKKKMYELLAERHLMHVLELPQKPDDRDAFIHWESELHKLKSALEKHFSTIITAKKLREAIAVMNQELKLKRELAALMKSDNPPLTGRELLEMKSLIAAIPADFEQYEKALTMLQGRKINPSAASRVRVLLTGVPLPHGAERVMVIIEDSGGLVVCQENCTGLKPLQEDVDESAGDLIHAIAEKYFHLPCSVMTPNHERIDRLRVLASEYRVDCIIELIWQACLTYDVESAWVKRLAEEELNLPYLRIETDFSPSDSVRIALRVQSLYETVKGRKVFNRRPPVSAVESLGTQGKGIG
jgi:benzoyl-CoA reductase/2-hydroxyglutaryl-CoA dehydratase subunit BcrC/BadD/HgdB